MRCFYLEPEVAGGFGEGTILDRSVHPPVVQKLHYKFDGWLGDVLLETFPCFIMTAAAADELKSQNIRGVEFDNVEISTSKEFDELFPNLQLPEFVWLKPNGIADQNDDVSVARDGRLIVSEKALKWLRELGIGHAIITSVY